MKRFSGPLSIGLIATACAASPSPARPAASPQGGLPRAQAEIDRVANTITPTGMYTHIEYLSSDALKGRETPGLGLEAAATWVTESFRDMGLQPAGAGGGWTQRWPLPRAGFDVSKTALRVEVGDWATGIRVGGDFFIIPAVGMPSASSPIVYAGSAGGIRRPIGRDAASRFVMMYLPGQRPDTAWRSAIESAMLSATNAGATGLVLILDRAFDEALLPRAGATLGAAAPIFLIGLKYPTARKILGEAGLDLDRLRMIDPKAVLPVSGARLTVSLARRNEVDHPPNVIGLLRGSDPALRDEYIVISAHMDHIGVGSPNLFGDSIFNGADDNASGTAAMIEVAEAFTRLESPPARSLLFVALSGEEMGLLGSAWFTDHPTVPADRMVANINLDMVGRNAPDTIVAIGQEYTSLGPLSHEIARRHPELRLTVAADPWPDEQLFFRSDHFNFARIGVPAIFFTSGVHADYHRQTDEIRWIDFDKTARVGRLVFYLANEVANALPRPEWSERGIADMKTVTGR